MSTVDQRLIDLLKSAGLYDRIAETLRLEKDATAADAHVASTGAGKSKKKPSDTEDDGKAYSFSEMLETVKRREAPRRLKPIDDKVSHSPFSHDANALANMRPDQVPRFLGAITDPSHLQTKTVQLNDLHSIQDRVDHGKVQAMIDARSAGTQTGASKPPVVFRSNDKNYIGDGHHRLAADFLSGKTEAEVKFIDLTPVSMAVKSLAFDVEAAARDRISKSEPGEFSIPFTITKSDAEHRLIFGWASVVEKNGKLIIDKQGDVIHPDDLEAAAYDYVLTSREMDDMHTANMTGRMVESMVFTKEKQQKLGIYGLLKNDQGEVIDTAWWCGWYADDDDMWSAIKRGERPELSIGGSSLRIPL